MKLSTGFGIVHNRHREAALATVVTERGTLMRKNDRFERNG